MRIALINGSPKQGHGSSRTLLKSSVGFFPSRDDLVFVGLHDGSLTAEKKALLLSADAWVIYFPLYVDALPSHLLSCFIALENEKKPKKIRLYGVCNCGFYEGKQTDCAFEVLENFAMRSGLEFCGGLGVGGGGMLSMAKVLEDQKGNKLLILGKLKRLALAVSKGKSFGVHYTQVNIPALMYKLGAELMWRIAVVKNGNKPWDIGRKL